MGLKSELEDALFKRSQGNAARVNQMRFDGGPFSDTPPPVKAQNKAAKNAYMDNTGIAAAKRGNGGVVYDPDTGNGYTSRDEARAGGRDINKTNQTAKNFGISKKMPGPVGRLPGALGMIGAGAAAAMFASKPTKANAAATAAGFTPAAPIAEWANPNSLNDMDEEKAVKSYRR